MENLRLSILLLFTTFLAHLKIDKLKKIYGV